MGVSQNDDSRMEGWLYLIRSNRFGLQYSRKRYFVLQDHLLKSFKSIPSSHDEDPIRRAIIDSCIRVADNGRESIQRRVFFIFTLYNASNHSDQLKLGADSPEEAARWMQSLQEAALKADQNQVVMDCPKSEAQSLRLNCSNKSHYSHSIDWTVHSSKVMDAMISDVVAPSPWTIFGCQNGLRLFKEAKDTEFYAKWDDHPAIMAVGVIDGSSEAIFQTLMSLGPSRSEWDFCFYKGSVIEHLDGHTDIVHKLLYRNGLPWGMKPRDLLLRRYWRREDDGTYVILYHSVFHQKCPPQTGYVRACLKSGGFVISPNNQGKQSVVKHMLAIDWKSWKSYLRRSSAQSITIRMLGRVAALRELFRAKVGDHLAADFSSGELMKERRFHQSGEGLAVDVQTRPESRKSMEAEDEEVVKTPSGQASLMGLNDATDEFFDVSEPLDYDQSENVWPSDFGPQSCSQDTRQPKLSTAAVFVKKLHDIAGKLRSSDNDGVLINGSTNGFFKSSRGLRQGDPLSPLLFVFIMETLSRMIKAMEERQGIRGFQIGSDMQLSHLLFADDTLIFCGNECQQIRHLRCLFLCFEAATGLKVNLGKSELIPVGRVDDVEFLASILNCKISSLPVTYLGLPLGESFKAKNIWDGVVEKTERRLAGWKRGYLSKGGRVTLIKSTLSNLPTYILSLFPIPDSVAKRVEKLHRDFLWGGMGEEKKLHLVSWEKVCMPLQLGGLGIRALKPFNKALLAKWLWRFACERGSLWRQVIRARHGGIEGDWCTKQVEGAYGVGLWKFIRKGWDDFQRGTSQVLGNGERFKFWDDPWCGDFILKESFPSLYNMAIDQVGNVASFLNTTGNQFVWEVQFNRGIQDWEADAISRFFEILYAQVPSRRAEDKLKWKGSRKGIFTVKGYYNSFYEHNVAHFPWRTIWKSKAPSRIAFFVWVATLHKIPTVDNLKKRGMILVNRCFMCKGDEETVNHLLIHCPMARTLWCWILGLIGIAWTMPNTVKDLMACWKRTWDHPQAHLTWQLLPLNLLWHIWEERNKRCFEDTTRTMEELKLTVFRSLRVWVDVLR